MVDGNVYGVPYMYGPNFLMYNTDVVTPAPTSWDITFEPELNGAPNPYAGKITAYDSAIYIADAAMYLMAHNPDLGITDPYELTQEQLDAATELLKASGADGREVLGALHGRDRRVRGRLDGRRDRVADQPQLRRGGRSGRSGRAERRA